MNFTPEMLASMAKVEAAREANIALEPRRMDRGRKGRAAARSIHPDYREDGFERNQGRPQRGSRRPRSSF